MLLLSSQHTTIHSTQYLIYSFAQKTKTALLFIQNSYRF